MERKKKFLILLVCIAVILLIIGIILLFLNNQQSSDIFNDQNQDENNNNNNNNSLVDNSTVNCKLIKDNMTYHIIMYVQDDGYVYETDYLETKKYKDESSFISDLYTYSRQDPMPNYTSDESNYTITITEHNELVDLEGNPKPLKKAYYISLLENGSWDCK